MKLLEKIKLERKLKRLKNMKSKYFFFDLESIWLLFVLLFFFSCVVFFIEVLLFGLSIDVFYITMTGVCAFLLFIFVNHYGFYSKRKSMFKKNILKKYKETESSLERYEIKDNIELYFKEAQSLKETGRIHLIDEFTLIAIMNNHKKYEEDNQVHSYFDKKETEIEKITIS